MDDFFEAQVEDSVENLMDEVEADPLLSFTLGLLVPDSI